MSYISHRAAPATFNNVQGLSPANGRKELARRRQFAEDLIESYREELAFKGAAPDYKLEGIVDVFVIMAQKLRLEWKAPPTDLPKLLEDLKGKPFLDFEPASVSIVVALGFYLGNTLIKNFQHLTWDIGKKSRVYWGQPVVCASKKVKYWAEDPVVMVADTMSIQYLRGGNKRDCFSDPIALHIRDAAMSFEDWRGAVDG